MHLVQKKQEISAPGLFTEQHLTLIKDMYFKGSTDEEFLMFVHVCKKTGLDPAMRQIFPVKRWDSKSKKEVMTIQTGIDGYRLIAERTGRYAPGREPTYQYKGDGKLLSATSYVKKQTADGTWHEIAATAFYDEFVQRNKEGNPTRFWQEMVHNQLSKCAEALALRKAFPGDLSGIYTQEEMAQADNSLSTPIDVPKITREEADEIENILMECDEDYVQKVRLALSTIKPQPIFDMIDLPRDLYVRIKSASLKNRELYLKRLEEETREVVHA